MGKLLTPTQYQEGAEGLNTLRPLSLGDKVDIDLVCPVGCSSATGKEKPFAGKLLETTVSGALLKNEVAFADKFQYISFTGFGPDSHFTFEFNQTVFGVLVKYRESLGSGIVYWSNSAWTIQYKLLVLETWVYIPMVDDVFYIDYQWISSGVTWIDVYGFYK